MTTKTTLDSDETQVQFAHFFGFRIFFFETIELENGSSYSFSLFQNPLSPFIFENNINLERMAETNGSNHTIAEPPAPTALALTSSPVKLDDHGPARKKSDLSPCRRSNRDRNVRCRF